MELREEGFWSVFSQDDAELRTYRPRPDVVLTVHRGYFGSPFVGPVVEAIDQALREQKPVYVFHDWAALRGYEPNARARLTSWVFGRLRDIVSLDVLLTVDSRILTMGIAASNLLLGGRMMVHPERETFEERLVQVLGHPLQSGVYPSP
ncbi:MAG: hypothetical protein IPJ34_05930 [Myxococcales bacterium]|nr:hypothetical protein [Myxococcales bacterium]